MAPRAQLPTPKRRVVTPANREQIGVTHIPHQDWAKRPTLRIQKGEAVMTVASCGGPGFPAATI